MSVFVQPCGRAFVQVLGHVASESYSLECLSSRFCIALISGEEKI